MAEMGCLRSIDSDDDCDQFLLTIKKQMSFNGGVIFTHFMHLLRNGIGNNKSCR